MRTALRTAAVAAHLLPPPCTWRAAQGTSGAGTCSAYCCISWLQLHPTATTCRSAATAGSHQGVESACAGARQPLQTQLVQESRTQQQLRPQPRAHVQQYSGWLNQRHCWSLWRTATPIVAQWQCASSCTNSAAPADAAAISHLGSRTRGAKRHYHALRSSEYKLESLVIFESCWRRFEERYGQDFRVPREVVWLNGAPGSGKGVNTHHILKTRGLTKHFTISSLLEGCPEARRLMEAGEMIPDQLVGDILLEALLLDEPGMQDDLGFVIDGFPRTATQVDFLKMLHEKLLELHHAHADGPHAIAFPRPSFKVVVLYVDEETSIRRQLQRARVANLHNRRVMDAGAGHFQEERSTDTDVDKCRKRYGIFKTHYAATLRLKQFFPFTLIDAMGSLEETRQQITKELRYQSSLDLSARTYEVIRHLPLAKDVVQSARQELVMRLDGYCEASYELFQEVIDRILNDVIPVVRQSGLAGHAEYVTRSPFFAENPVAIDMLVDVMTDRGFHVAYIREDTLLPEHVDPETGAVRCALRPCHRFRIQFDARGPRDDIKVLEIAARMTEATAGGGPTAPRDVRISHSVIPEHLLGPGENEGGDPDGDPSGGNGSGGGRLEGFMGS